MDVNIRYDKFKESEIEERKLKFPDGIDRIVSLESRYWRQFEFAIRFNGADATEDIAEVAYELAKEFHKIDGDSFEDSIREKMPIAIWSEINSIYSIKCDPSQDDSAN